MAKLKNISFFPKTAVKRDVTFAGKRNPDYYPNLAILAHGLPRNIEDKEIVSIKED